MFPYIKNASFSACSLEANADLTRLDGFKEEDAILVYSCPSCHHVYSLCGTLNKKENMDLTEAMVQFEVLVTCPLPYST